MIDGLWSAKPVDPSDAREQHAGPYSEETSDSLPMMSPDVSIADVRRAIERAGFRELTEARLDNVERIERGLDPEAASTPRFLIRAITP